MSKVLKKLDSIGAGRRVSQTRLAVRGTAHPPNFAGMTIVNVTNFSTTTLDQIMIDRGIQDRKAVRQDRKKGC
jgi:hypothetical protein